MPTHTLIRCLVCLVVIASVAPAQPTPAKPKGDAEQLLGDWVLQLGKRKVTLVMIFRDGEEGQFNLTRPTEKAGEVEFLGGAGFGYKLSTRDKKKILLLDDCLWFDGKKAVVEYDFVDGKLRLGEATMNKDAGGASLMGDWTRPKK